MILNYYRTQRKSTVTRDRFKSGNEQSDAILSKKD